ncbi:MAG: RibD family protein [Anaerolineales bacterium]|jgi:3,4-dihydroxy 2-butanone 4-phosphate synthase/GTP cyclohydrolase II
MSEALKALYECVPPPNPVPHRAFVTLSYAQSLDGSIAAVPGQSLQLSGQAALEMTHQLRAMHDGILVGIGTVLADNPRLTTRLVEGSHPQPVILDTRLRIPLNAKILEHPRSVLIVCAEGSHRGRKEALFQTGAELIALPLDRDGFLDLDSLLAILKTRGIESLMVEGGVRVLTKFLRQALVDLLVLTINPRLVGGLHAPDELLQAQPKLLSPRWIQLGEDQIVWGFLEWMAT